MPYVDLAGLSRFASRQKDRMERDYALLRDMQWLRTEKAGAVSLWPVGGTPLEPSVDFLFSETPPASGDKGPDNPSTITGVSSVYLVRKGKNLSVKRSSKTHNGVTFTSNGDGTYTVNGTASGGTAQLDLITKSNKVLAMTGKPVIPSGCPTGGDSSTYSTYVSAHDKSGTWRQSTYDIGGNTTPLVPNQDGVFVYSILLKNGTSVSSLLFKPQLEYGDTVTSFEEPVGEGYAVDLDGTYFGGTLDVASGVMTVTHRGFELNPDLMSIACNTSYEGVNTSACYFTPGPQRALKKACAWSNRFVTDKTIGSLMRDTEMIFTSSSGTSILLRINKTLLGSSYDASSASAIKAAWVAWLKANPTDIVYELAVPQTVQLSSLALSALAQPDKYTPRLNTVYTDAQSVQVGYVKSPIRDEYELQQAVIAQGGNV